MKQLWTIVNASWDEGMQVACTVIVRLAIQTIFWIYFIEAYTCAFVGSCCSRLNVAHHMNRRLWMIRLSWHNAI